MKKILAAIIALSVVVGIAAPAFAWPSDTCPFTDKSMCVTQSLSDDINDDA